MKLKRTVHTKFSTWSLCLVALWPLLAIGHPDSPTVGGRAGNTSGAEPADAPPKRPSGPQPRGAVAPSGDNAVDSSQPGKGGIPEQPKLWITEQRQYGYLNNIQLSVDQASHEHVDRARERQPTPFPLEIWYVATVKWLQAGEGAPFYCVAPRVENPLAQVWPRQFVVTLKRVENLNQTTVVVSREVVGVAAGGSMELFSHCIQSVKPPSWIIETPHGKAKVNLPGRNSERTNPPPSERR